MLRLPPAEFDVKTPWDRNRELRTALVSRFSTIVVLLVLLMPVLPAVRVVAALSQREPRAGRRCQNWIFCRTLELQYTATVSTASIRMHAAPVTIPTMIFLWDEPVGVAASYVGSIRIGLVAAAQEIAAFGSSVTVRIDSVWKKVEADGSPECGGLNMGGGSSETPVRAFWTGPLRVAFSELAGLDDTGPLITRNKLG